MSQCTPYKALFKQHGARNAIKDEYCLIDIQSVIQIGKHVNIPRIISPSTYFDIIPNEIAKACHLKDVQLLYFWGECAILCDCLFYDGLEVL